MANLRFPVTSFKAKPLRRLPPGAMKAHAAFAYRNKAGRREYERANIRSGTDGALEAVKFPREGAGLPSSPIETDGLVELPESTTQVEPGTTVAFLPKAWRRVTLSRR